MAPRKKPIASNTTSSKKSNSKAQPQASKFGIQHFFGHHTQNSQKPNKGAASAPPQNPKPLAAAFSSTIATAQLVPKIRKPAQIDGGNPVLVSVNDENRSNSKLGNKNSMLQYTPPENLMAARVGGGKENVDGEASPEISKSKSINRFKFSPGMVSLGPLMFASKFVLVGDHYQLPPLVKSTEARENGMGVGLFCRLSEAHPQAISALQSQYRMCRGIMELSNALIYGDRLHCASPEIENAKLKVSSSISSSLWIQEVINPSKPVIFINTDSLPAFEEKGHKIVSNPTEANIIVQVVEGIVKSGIKGEDIGVITPYNSQVDIIWLAFNRLTSVEVHTIDKYQKKLIMVGSCKTISKVVLMKLLIEQVEQQSGILNVSNKDIKFNSELRRCSQSQAQVR